MTKQTTEEENTTTATEETIVAKKVATKAPAKAPAKKSVAKKEVSAETETTTATVKPAKTVKAPAPKAEKETVTKEESAEEVAPKAGKAEAATTESTATDAKASPKTDAASTYKVTFKDFGLKSGLQQAIDKLGYSEPTQIQAEVWAAAQEGSNIIAQSQTGTGKTTAFLLPILQAIDNKNRFPQVLIVAPTRELVQQIREDIMTLTEFYPMRSLCVIGGRKLMFQKEDLKYGPQFLVATPGRLIEFIQKRLIDTSKITHFVLDEVDRMLDMWFIEDVDRIWEQLNGLKQTMTFSATINNEIKDIINKHCDEFTHIRVGEKITVDKIDHTYIDIAHNHKFNTLIHILKQHPDQKTIIFAQTKRNTEVITRALKDAKHTCAYLNGDLDQRERNRALRAFKEWVCKVLITTDVAARWLNMDNVQLVVNFDVPREPESYIHRIGRTGRAGAEGKAIMFVDRDEQHLIMDIERTQKIKLKKSGEFTGVEDKNMDYIDVNLDRPLPPSDKKRRMVARGIARDGGRSSGWYGGRSGWGDRGWYGGRSSSNDRGGYGRSSGGSADRGGYAGRSSSSDRGSSDRPRSSGYGRDANSAPRSFGSERSSSFSDRPARSSSFGDRSSSSDRSSAPRSSGSSFGQRSFGGERSNERSSGSSDRGGYAGRSSSSDRGGYSNERSGRTYGSSPRGTSQRSIGGYDPIEVAQTNINASRAPRPPRDFSFNEQPRERSTSRSGSSDRGGYAGRSSSSDRGGFSSRSSNSSSDRSRAPRSTNSGERSARPSSSDRAPRQNSR